MYISYDEICKLLQMTDMVRNNKGSNKLLVTQKKITYSMLIRYNSYPTAKFTKFFGCTTKRW